MPAKNREALHSFQFRHAVHGLVQVVKGEVYPYGHPAVRHRPGWFATTDSPVDPETGDDNPDNGEE